MEMLINLKMCIEVWLIGEILTDKYFLIPVDVSHALNPKGFGA